MGIRELALFINWLRVAYEEEVMTRTEQSSVRRPSRGIAVNHI